MAGDIKMMATDGMTEKYDAWSMVMVSMCDAFEMRTGIAGDGQQNNAPRLKDAIQAKEISGSD